MAARLKSCAPFGCPRTLAKNSLPADLTLSVPSSSGQLKQEAS